MATVEGNRRVYHSQSRLRSGWWALAVFVSAVVLWGGYSHRWPWTGINGRTATLWDWLNLVMLPIAFALLPVWFDPRQRITRRRKQVGAGAVILFAALVAAGYLIPWRWTGFVGTTLWRWLELLLVPLAVALTPIFPELRARWTRRDTAIACAALGVFAVVVVLGYLERWTWTGFHGNTLWDWLHLLLLPLVVPIVVLPVLQPRPDRGVLSIQHAIAGTEAPAPPRAAGDAQPRPTDD